jgi:hypothetical protein
MLPLCVSVQSSFYLSKNATDFHETPYNRYAIRQAYVFVLIFYSQ